MLSELPPSGIRDAAHSRRVLVVDDDADSLELFCMMLTEGGHHSRAAMCAAQALTIAAEFQPQVALIDIGLPGTDGHELASLLRLVQGLEHCRLIAVTGYSDEQAIRRSMTVGFEAHLTKPVTIKDVLTAVGQRGDQEHLAR
jgi:CheY-like chemotaxis protein